MAHFEILLKNHLIENLNEQLYIFHRKEERRLWSSIAVYICLCSQHKYTYQLSETSTGMLCVHILIVIARIRNYDLSFHEATDSMVHLLPTSFLQGSRGWGVAFLVETCAHGGDVVR